MTFKKKIISGLNEMIQLGWTTICTHDIECQDRVYRGKKVTAIYIENGIVSIFFEDDYEYQMNSDAFIDYLLQGKMISVKDYAEKEIYPNY